MAKNQSKSQSKQQSKSTEASALVDQADSLVAMRIDELKQSLHELIEHPSLADLPDLDELKSRVQSQVSEASDSLQSARATAAATISARAEDIDEYAHAEPWKVAGIAAAVGLPIGVLISSR